MPDLEWLDYSVPVTFATITNQRKVSRPLRRRNKVRIFRDIRSEGIVP